MTASDKRGKKINEIITGIKIIKFNAWEKIMNNLVKQYRMKEGIYIFREFLIYNMSHAINSLIPTFMGLTIFTLYQHYSGKVLSIPQIYQLVALFNSFSAPIKYAIMANTSRLDANISNGRVSSIINIKPIERKKDSSELKRGEVEISNGCFNWNDPQYYQLFEKKEMEPEKRKAYILKNINLKIFKGEFVAIIGKVGSGKSSLILALMDEMVRHEGSVKKNGNMAYISQEAFLQNDTIENNITFGKEYDHKKITDVITICEMNPDLDILPGGEKTEIGERGINMSGGQKQRINIARAVYSESDIFLIDDALSALDAHVGKKIMNNVFKRRLKGKTRVMVTHFLHLLHDVDKVVLIDAGEIKAYGTFEEIRKTSAFFNYVRAKNNSQKKSSLKQSQQDSPNKGIPAPIMENVDEEDRPTLTARNERPSDMDQIAQTSQPEPVSEDQAKTESGLGSADQNDKPEGPEDQKEATKEQKNVDNEEEEDSEDEELRPRQNSQEIIQQTLEDMEGTSGDNDEDVGDYNDGHKYKAPPKDEEDVLETKTGRVPEEANVANPNQPDKAANAGKLTVEEKRDVGMSGLKFYIFYFKNIGGCLTFTTIFYFAFSIALKMFCDWWVGRWAENSFGLTRDTYVTVYLLGGAAAIIFMIIRAVSMGYIAKLGALTMFRSIVWNIMRRPMSFFDTTPSGVIINRCTSDVNEVDYLIPWLMSFLFSVFFLFIGSLVLAITASPVVILFLIIGITIVYRSLKLYLKTSVEIKRLMQLGISPLVSIASEFIEGSTILRVYGKGDKMLERYQKKADMYHTAFHHSDRINVWMRSILEVCFASVFIVIVISVVLNQQFR